MPCPYTTPLPLSTRSSDPGHVPAKLKLRAGRGAEGRSRGGEGRGRVRLIVLHLLAPVLCGAGQSRPPSVSLAAPEGEGSRPRVPSPRVTGRAGTRGARRACTGQEASAKMTLARGPAPSSGPPRQCLSSSYASSRSPPVLVAQTGRGLSQEPGPSHHGAHPTTRMTRSEGSSNPRRGVTTGPRTMARFLSQEEV
jgi:hypothetical protein